VKIFFIIYTQNNTLRLRVERMMTKMKQR